MVSFEWSIRGVGVAGYVAWMNDFEIQPDGDDSFFPTTTDGVELRVNSEVVANEKEVALKLGDVEGAQTLYLPPSHARELAKHLTEAADALDNEFPGSPRR